MPVELTSFGDKELYLAKGKTPGGEWIIPVYVIYYRSDKQEFCKVAPAVGLGPEQAGYLYYHFSIHNQWKRRDVFLVNREHLRQLAEKAGGVTPAYYYRWPGVPLPPQDGNKLKFAEEDIVEAIPKETESFLKWVSRRRSINLNILRLAWSAVAQESAEWLLRKKKPINLGFVTLHAFPYRVNWKEILLAMYPDAYWWLKHRRQDMEPELLNQLVTLELMALQVSSHYKLWSLEAVPTEAWEKNVAEIELMRKAGGETDYVRLHEKTVVDLAPGILEVFAAYIEKASRPFPEIRSVSRIGGQKLVPYRGPQKVLPRIGKNIPCRIMVDAGPPSLRKKQFDQHVLVRPKNFSVPPVPNLLPAPNDVREPDEQGVVEQPANGSETAGGVQMPSALQNEKQMGELLVVRPEPGNESLANGT